MAKWKLNSWKDKPVKHIPEYENKEQLRNVLNELSSFPPLVFAGETRSLLKNLADVSQGKAFLLQGWRLQQKALLNFIQIILEIF